MSDDTKQCRSTSASSGRPISKKRRKANQIVRLLERWGKAFLLLRAEDAVRPSQDRTGPAEPFASGHIAYTVAMLVHTGMASFAEDHGIVVVCIGQETYVADSGVVVAGLLLQSGSDFLGSGKLENDDGILQLLFADWRLA